MFGRKVLLQVVRRMPGQENYNIKLVQALQDRIPTWLLPAYGYSKEEELGTLSPEDLQGALIQKGGQHDAQRGYLQVLRKPVLPFLSLPCCSDN